MRKTALFSSLLSLLSFPACSSGDSTAPGSAGPVEITVVDMSGAPVAGAPLRIEGTVLTTDARGQVSALSVPARYVVALATPDGKHAYVFDGLTGRAPTLAIEQFATPRKQATIHVALPSAEVMLLASLRGVASREGIVSAHSDSTDLTLRWTGGSPPDLFLSAVHFTSDLSTGAPSHYDGYATMTQPLEDGASLTWAPTLAPPPFGEHLLSLDSSGPALDGAQAVLHVAAPADATLFPFRIAGTVGRGTGASILIPELPDARMTLEISALFSPTTFATTLVPGVGATTAPVRVTFGPSVDALSPAKDVTGFGPGDTFTWSAPPDRVTQIALRPYDGAWQDEPDVTLFTTRTQQALPSLEDLGVRLPSGAGYSWTVEVSSSIASIDAAAATHFHDMSRAGVSSGSAPRELKLR